MPGEAATVHVGGWFTVTVANAEVLSPAALWPTTEYVAVEVGETLPLEADDAKPEVHVYDVAAGLQLAVRVQAPPRLMVLGEAVSVHAGTGAGVSQKAVILLAHEQLAGKYELVTPW